jgi:hypothetical protein
MLGNLSRGAKDSRADGVADDYREAEADTEHAKQMAADSVSRDSFCHLCNLGSGVELYKKSVTLLSPH